jgi:hypothetical protein
MLKVISPVFHEGSEAFGENRPYKQQPETDLLSISDKVFTLASQHLSQSAILENIQRWIKEDRSAFLVDILANPGSSLGDISSAIERFHLLAPQGIELTAPREKWFRTSLIRRVLSDHPWFIEVAKNYININDFSGFMHRAGRARDFSWQRRFLTNRGVIKNYCGWLRLRRHGTLLRTVFFISSVITTLKTLLSKSIKIWFRSGKSTRMYWPYSRTHPSPLRLSKGFR